MSPHVTIYRFPIAALTSITNRVTGVMLTVGNHFHLYMYVYILDRYSLGRSQKLFYQ